MEGEADAVAERELKTFHRVLPCSVLCVLYPAGSNTSQTRSYSSRPVILARSCPLDRLEHERLHRTHLLADLADDERPGMSAQQPDSSSRGQRSMTIGRSAGNGPEPGRDRTHSRERRR